MGLFPVNTLNISEDAPLPQQQVTEMGSLWATLLPLLF